MGEDPREETEEGGSGKYRTPRKQIAENSNCEKTNQNGDKRRKQ
jgi:hypothetical protein